MNVKNDNDLLWKHYMDTILFPLPKGNNHYINRDALELIVRKDCNQKCEYCYIYQHGDELYPNHLTKEETLHNVNLILDYLYNTRRQFFYTIELFAGDLFYDDIFFDILDLFEKYISEIYIEEPLIFEKRTRFLVPCNLSFIYDNPEKLDKLKVKKKELLEKYNFEISFSWSTDGLYGVENREKKKLTDEYFDFIFDKIKDFYVGLHPMTYASNMDNAIESYDWWIEKVEKHYLPLNKNQDFQPMMLEVRNANEWTDEAIDKYLKLLDHIMQVRFEKCHNSVEELAWHFYADNREQLEKKNILKKQDNYDLILLPKVSDNKNPIKSQIERISCGLQGAIHFNCTNLSIVPCHRLAYSLFTAVYFKTDENNEKIIDFKSHNIEAVITAKTIKEQNLPMCNVCKFSEICVKGCMGAQFEYNSDLLLPIPSVCNLFKRKFKHLVKLYNEYGIIDKALELNLIDQRTKDYYNSLLEE